MPRTQVIIATKPVLGVQQDSGNDTTTRDNRTPKHIVLRERSFIRTVDNSAIFGSGSRSSGSSDANGVSIGTISSSFFLRSIIKTF